MPSLSSPLLLSGPQALRAELERTVRARRAAQQRDLRLLAQTTLIVVPSHHLAHQVQALLCGLGTTGMRVATAAQAARDVLQRAGLPQRGGAGWMEAMLRAEVRAQGLEQALISSEGSWGLLLATTGDLLDAGLTHDCLEAAWEALPTTEVRARQLVQLAAALDARLEAAGLGRPHHIYAQAAEALRQRDIVWGFHDVWIVGFADATGMLTLFLEALQRSSNCTVYWDATQACVQASSQAGGARFGRALREALGVHAQSLPATQQLPRLVRASTRGVEARLLATDIHAALQRGVQPEQIALVVRTHDAHSSRLGQALRELGIPVASTDMRRDAATRPLLALADVWERGGSAGLKNWCSAMQHTAPEVRLGLAVLGLRSVHELAQGTAIAALPEQGVRLPTRLWDGGGGDREPDTDDSHGQDDESEDSQASSAEAESQADTRDSDSADDGRWLAKATVVRMQNQALRFLEHWAFEEHMDADAMLVRSMQALDQLELPAAAQERVQAALQALHDCRPRQVSVTAADVRRLVCRVLRDEALQAPTTGGGVVLATASQLRSCAFERLYVPLCEYGRWPRVPQEDPLLPDSLRALLQVVLPALARKLDGREEEAGLRASLLNAATHVCVSHARLDDGNEELRPSPWFDEWSAQPGANVVDVRETLYDADEPLDGPRTTRERALRASQRLRVRQADGLTPLHRLQVREARLRYGLPNADAQAIVAARLQWLQECEAPLAQQRFPSALLGKDCPNHLTAMHATTLEDYVKCPWQTLLRRGLRVRAPLDPEADLPTLDARLVGIALHAAAALLAPEPSGALSELLHRPARRPDVAPARLLAVAQQAANNTLRSEGLADRGLEPLLIQRVRSLLELMLRYSPATRSSTADLGNDGWIAAEVEGEWDSGLPSLGRVRFRADRLEKVQGQPQLVDLKTGRPLHGSGSEGAKYIQSGLMKRNAKGGLVQGMLYALATQQPARYDHLDEKTGCTPRTQYLVDPHNQPDMERDFRSVLQVVAEAMKQGQWLPRLTDAQGVRTGPACGHCEVALACRQGDTAAALRLRTWIQHERDLALQGEAPPSALLQLWDLPYAKKVQA